MSATLFNIAWAIVLLGAAILLFVRSRDRRKRDREADAPRFPKPNRDTKGASGSAADLVPDAPTSLPGSGASSAPAPVATAGEQATGHEGGGAQPEAGSGPPRLS